ncbi:MAG TPA: metallophosphoesterase family protein [Bacteroidia bacterium]|nr:metallophosphoesterase family protein [Bacteroidia bacterium]
MKKIGLLSDTHGFLDERFFELFSSCDEVWHAGDIGDIAVSDVLEKFKPLRTVYGNVDGTKIRAAFPEENIFLCEQVKVFLIHIGGYPGNYFPGIKEKLTVHKPGLFICGHSHILKVIRDEKFNLLHINPGAAGMYGMHKIRTAIRFEIDGKKIQNLEVIELGERGKI